ncbi:cytochrome c [Dyadobacter sp. CY323]|uniref:c-type cytochrome n=1 Tax=Dyadobacter sp. CY323 TaxID=2907302 RepID=UPI001F44AE26|nr:cytochrome c [Dyadobacter sp. CY323]MCE6989461.1 cytochrome c [Dyadobacter sp. CY323]
MRRNQFFAASMIVLSGAGLAGFSSEETHFRQLQQDPWKAPAWADTLKSPYHEEPLTLAQGEELFTLYCASCHGEEGYGDGAAGGALGQKPANFHDTLVKSQSDGAFFWKISTGRGNMPPFKDVFTDEQRWQLVAYLRHLGKTE